jgi:hypothetical protein
MVCRGTRRSAQPCRQANCLECPNPFARAPIISNAPYHSNSHYCFDLFDRGDDDLRDEPYARWYGAALDLVDAVPHDAPRYADTAVTAAAKAAAR